MELLKRNTKDYIQRILILNVDSEISLDKNKEIFRKSKDFSFKDVAIMNDKTIFIYNEYFDYINEFQLIDDRVIDKVEKSFKTFNFNQRKVSGVVTQSIPITYLEKNGEVKGLDLKFMIFLSQVLNAKIEIIYSTLFGSKESNGTITGSFRLLYDKSTDAIFSQIFIKNYYIDEFTFTESIDSDKLCVVVPKLGRKPKWIALFSTFTLKVWIFLLISFLTTIASLYYLRKLNHLTTPEQNRSRNSHDYDFKPFTVVTDTFHIYFNIPKAAFSRRTHEKLIMSINLLFILIASTAFQSSLSTVLTTPKYYNNFKTLEELSVTNALISTHSKSLSDTFQAYNQSYMKKLNENLIVLPYNIPNYSNFLARLTKTKFEMNNQAKIGKISIHTIPECPQNYLLAFVVRRDSLMLQEINYVIRGALEGGFYNKWYRDIVGDDLKSIQDVQIRPFTVIDLQTAFYVLFIGYCSSIIAFLLEIYKKQP
nr:uncharacterized protein LOC111415980 [Onthophagus taurus]